MLGSSTKQDLKESPFIRYLNQGKHKDGYWNYNHMVVILEDCVDCMEYLHPELEVMFELDHSSGHSYF